MKAPICPFTFICIKYLLYLDQAHSHLVSRVLPRRQLVTRLGVRKRKQTVANCVAVLILFHENTHFCSFLPRKLSPVNQN